MSDHNAYSRFTGKAQLEKAVNSLLGLIEGVTIDSVINDSEIAFLGTWLETHRINAKRHPFNELIPAVETALADGVLTADERSDLVWLCNRLTASDYFDRTTADMQQLHAVAAGIASDGIISAQELSGLSQWLEDHEHLKRCWPYDEIESLITSILADKRIDADEHKLLMDFFGEFVAVLDNRTLVSPLVLAGKNIAGLCATCPDISFSDSVFCLTGASAKYPRKEFERVIREYGGQTVNTVSKKVSYLVVGSEGNPCWAYACYGRKVEEAVELRKKGALLLIIHENDFHDAVADRQL